MNSDFEKDFLKLVMKIQTSLEIFKELTSALNNKINLDYMDYRNYKIYDIKLKRKTNEQ